MTILRLISPLCRVPTAVLVNIGQQQPAVAASTSTAIARRVRISDAKWRQQNNLPVCTNSAGPLTNLPDYTFQDGRPTPLGSHQKKRVLLQREYAERIVQLSRELDQAKERLPRLQREAEQKRQAVLDAKLKPKGYRLLKGAEAGQQQ